jgi:hypothetical protein
MKTKLYILLISSLILNFTNLALADTIILKDGTVLQGTLKSATEFTIMFEVNGEVKEFKINDVTNITFTSRVEQVSTKTSVVNSGAVIIPANTKITARTSEDISTSSHQEGSKVTAVLELDLIINDQIIVPKGSTLYGIVTESIGGRRVGKQSIKIIFNEIVINGKTVAIVTDPIGAEGGRGQTAKIIGASALIGAAAGDAGKGALVGTGLVLLAGGKHIQIPEGTLFDLVIKQEVETQ